MIRKQIIKEFKQTERYGRAGELVEETWPSIQKLEERSDYENLPINKIEWWSDNDGDIRTLRFTNKGG